jgi:integrase
MTGLASHMGLAHVAPTQHGPTVNVTILERSRGVFRLRVETKGVGGVRKFAYEVVKGTREDAEARRLEIIRAYRDEVGLARGRGGNMRLSDYLDKWIEGRRKRGDVTDGTADWYKTMIAPLREPLGFLPLDAITPAVVQQVYDDLLDKVSPQTVRHIHARLTAALEDAVIDGRLKAHPLKGKVRLPKVETAKHDTLSDEQVQMFLAHVRDHGSADLYALVLLAAATGLRRGELCALTWEAVDFVNSKVTVRQTAVSVGSTTVVKRPKTPASVRTITVAGAVMNVLREMREARKGWAAKWVFPADHGGVMSPGAMTHRVNRCLKEVGLGDFTLHDLRHAHATFLLRNKMPVKSVSERLGHADVLVTMRTYQHVIPKDDEALAALTETLFASPSKETGPDREDD